MQKPVDFIYLPDVPQLLIGYLFRNAFQPSLAFSSYTDEDYKFDNAEANCRGGARSERCGVSGNILPASRRKWRHRLYEHISAARVRARANKSVKC